MLNTENKLVGKLHYIIQPGAKMTFDHFDEEGNVVHTVEVTTREDMCVYVEDTTVEVSPISLVCE